MTSLSKVSPAANFVDGVRLADDFDIGLVTTLISALLHENDCLEKLHWDLLVVVLRETKKRQRCDRTADRRAAASSNPGATPVSRFPSWAEIRDETRDNLFCCKFWRTKGDFALVCDKIKAAVGSAEFDNKKGVCGEVRVAIGLRLLCGGSYLDLVGRTYGVQSAQSVYTYFHIFISWLDRTFSFPPVALLQRLKDGDKSALDELKLIANHFAVDSDGVFMGCIGAIDGLAVRIRSPSNVADPSNYFCRKCFYALNVQAICDCLKRILWISPGHQVRASSLSILHPFQLTFTYPFQLYGQGFNTRLCCLVTD